MSLRRFGNQGLVIEDPGELYTDIYGLETCTCVIKAPLDLRSATSLQSSVLLLPALGSAHPYFSWMGLEKRRISMRGGFATMRGEYAGINSATSTPIYELLFGVSEEPLETNKRFVSHIGGKPSAPLHGAVFYDGDGKAINPQGTAVSGKDAEAIFHHFTLLVGGVRNPKYGITSYLNAAQMTWRKSWTSKLQATDLADVGTIDSPEGFSGSVPGGSTWLSVGVQSTKRGSAYSSSQEWRLSGPNGWDTDIYG